MASASGRTSMSLLLDPTLYASYQPLATSRKLGSCNAFDRIDGHAGFSRAGDIYEHNVFRCRLDNLVSENFRTFLKETDFVAAVLIRETDRHSRFSQT